MFRIPSIGGPRALRAGLAVAMTSAATLFAGAGSAQAVVIDMAVQSSSPQAYAAGAQTSAGQNGAPDTENYYGVALTTDSSMPSYLAASHIPTVSSSGTCTDPQLAAEFWYAGNPFTLPPSGLCSHGGDVMQGNETFVLTWDAGVTRSYWAKTRSYIEGYLSDVAAASHTGTSPYAVSPQYSGGNNFAQGASTNGSALNASVFGGGCIDYGSRGGSSCKFTNTKIQPSPTGYSYHQWASACTPSQLGTNQWAAYPNGGLGTAPNTECLSDADIRAEVAQQVHDQGIVGRTVAGYTPLVVVLTPPGVVDCLDQAGALCSANGSQTTASNAPTALFCSYHGEVNVDGKWVPYLVQPWTAGWGTATNCDDPDLPNIPATFTDVEIGNDVGERLVSPLSQAHLAAITNPYFDGWFSTAGSEINDNGCTPAGSTSNQLDAATLGSNTYYLQREFNNAGLLVSDPSTSVCPQYVNLEPNFVVPSAVEPGDVVEFDGSATLSSLAVANAGYQWTFGDGTTAVGPSVVHSYAAGGSYTATLTVTDRGGTKQSISQVVQVLGPDGQPVPAPTGGGTSGTPTSPTGATGGGATGTPASPTGASTGGPTTGGTAPAAPASSGTTPTPKPAVIAQPLAVHVQLMPESLRSLITSGMAIRVRANAAADGIVTVSVTRAAAKRAHLQVGAGPQVIVGRGTLSGKIRGGTVTLRLVLNRATAAKLRVLRHLKVTVHLSLVDGKGHRETYVVAGQF